MKFKKATVNIIDSYEFDKLVEEKLGFDYEFNVDEETPNDTDYYYPNVTSESHTLEDIGDYEKALETGKDERGYSLRIWHILPILCKEKYISPGNYLIRVSW